MVRLALAFNLKHISGCFLTICFSPFATTRHRKGAQKPMTMKKIQTCPDGDRAENIVEHLNLVSQECVNKPVDNIISIQRYYMQFLFHSL